VELLEGRDVPAAITEFALPGGLPAPQGIVADAGNLWYTDPGANKIGQRTLGGAVTEYSLAAAGADPRGIAIGSDGAVWFTLFGADAIGRLNPATGVITQFALPVGSAPSEIASGSDGRLWFTMIGTDSIGAITTAGVFSSVATLNTGDAPFGITAGPDGRLWFTQFGSNQIGAITTAGVLSEFSVSTAVEPGAGITTGPDGNLWFGSSSAAVIGRITTAGVLTEFTGFGEMGSSVTDIVAGPDGALWFTQGAGDAVGRINTTGTVTNEFETTELGLPAGIASGSDGNLYFTEPGVAAVTQITTAGVQSTTQLVASSGPTEVVATADGTVYYSQSDANKIGRRVAGTNAIIEYNLPTPLSDPRGLAAGPDGNIWVALFGADRIARITPAGAITEFSTGLTVGAAPRDIATGPDGALWFTEAGADQIGRIDTTGTITEFAVPGAGSIPFEIALGSDNRLWFTQNGSNEIGAITSAGVVSEFAVPGTDSQPLGIALGADGAVWFTQFASGQIGRADTAGIISEFATVSANSGPTSIASAIDGRLWFTQANVNALGQISVGGVAAESSDGLTDPAGLAGIATTANGSLVAAETTANQLANIFVGSPFNAASTIAAGTDRGALNRVRVLNGEGAELYSVVPFDPNFQGGVRTALADVDGDGIADLIAGTGPGTVTRVVVINGDTQEVLFDFMPFEPSFLGGVYVSAGDLNGDGIADIAVSPDEGGGPRVDIYAGGANLNRIGSFFGIADPNFRGGARTAVGDVDGDGRADLAVAAGFGGGPRVAVFDGNTITNMDPTRLFNDFFAFEQTLRNGVFIAIGDLDGDGSAEVIAGGGPGGGPRVTAFNGGLLVSSGGATMTPVANFFAGDPNLRGGIRLTTKNLDGDALADIVTGAGTGGGSTVTEYLGVLVAANPGAPPPELSFDGIPGFTGGVFVG
jgi:streptogramin lyase